MSEVIRTLKDGYWDRTTVIRTSEGSLRVRKESKETDNPGPWAREALRNEISYLDSIPEAARDYLPVLLLSWDDKTTGYEIPYYEDRPDLACLVLEGSLGPDDAKEIQRQLVEAVLIGLHSAEQVDGAPFCAHLEEVLTESIEALAGEDHFHEIVETESLVLNGQTLPGLRASHAHLRVSGILNHLAGQSSVRLHGDLLLENILWPPLLLIDPVSVAGLVMGHPHFDLVKHES
ncbi:MAG: phosphotransferase, partial [Verrucomicrobiota bacterium]|nr:phosphotransferase [Verrucomicrobiota bacterium]